jgi:hypothetical protein
VVRATILAALAAAAVLTVSACGSAGAAGSTTLGGAASLAPSDTVAFIAIDSNLSSGQWDSLNGLLDKFPSRDKLLAQLRQGFEQKTKVDWETDVKPALGDELDIVVLSGKQKQYVGLTQSHDQAKLDALLKKAGAVSMQVAGWTAFAETQGALDTFAAAKAKLVDDNLYRVATAKLSDTALVHAYANGIEAQKLLNLTTKDPTQAVGFEWASADVTAAGDGLRFHAYARDGMMANIPAQRRPVPTQPYQSHLLDEIPAGALLVADFVAKPGMFELADGSKLPLQGALHADPTLLAKLDQIVGGETALYVRQGGLMMPELTIVTQPGDTHAAEAALADVLKTLKAQGTGILGRLDFVHAVIGGQLVASTSQKGIEDFRSGGAKLSGDSTFERARKSVGMPSETTGFLFVNVKDALPLVQAFGPLLGLKVAPALQNADLSALRTLAAYGSRAGDEQSYTVYLQVQ